MISNNDVIIRPIKTDDNVRDIINILSELTVVDIEKENEADVLKFIEELNDNHVIFVMENTNNELIGLGTVFIEQKIIHNMGCVGHIEDIVLTKKYRGVGLGKYFINHLIEFCKERKCYKIVLYCSDKKIDFYKKCGFEKKSNQMAIYL